MTLANKPLEELQALRDEQAEAIAAFTSALAETEAAIAAKADKREAAYQAYINRLEPGCAGVDMKFTFYAGYNAAAHDLAPAEPVDDAWIERTAIKIVRDFYPQMPDGYRGRRYHICAAAIRATLARCARWPDTDALRIMAYKASEPGDSYERSCLRMATMLRAYQTGAAS